MKEGSTIMQENGKTSFHYIRTIWSYLQVIIVAFIIVFGFIRPFVVEAFKIPSGSMEDTLLVGMDKVSDSLRSIGTDSVGPIPSECSEEFLEIYNSADLIVAKGMGYAETLTELDLKAPHLLLLRTKCMNVSDYFGVPRHKNIAKLI